MESSKNFGEPFGPTGGRFWALGDAAMDDVDIGIVASTSPVGDISYLCRSPITDADRALGFEMTRAYKRWNKRQAQMFASLTFALV